MLRQTHETFNQVTRTVYRNMSKRIVEIIKYQRKKPFFSAFLYSYIFIITYNNYIMNTKNTT